MIIRLRSISLVMLCVTTLIAEGQTSILRAEPVKLDVAGFNEVIADTGKVLVAGRPTREALTWAHTQGVTTIINLRSDEEMARDKDSFDEAALARGLGLEYVQLPLGADASYTPAIVDAFDAALKAANGRVLLHCNSGRRASYLWAAWQYRYGGLSVDEAVSEATRINFGRLPLEGLLGQTLTFGVQEEGDDKAPGQQIP